MMLGYDSFLLEKMGLSQDVRQQAVHIMRRLWQEDSKDSFLFWYSVNDKLRYPLRVIIDPEGKYSSNLNTCVFVARKEFKNASELHQYFFGESDIPGGQDGVPYIILRNRSKLGDLIHELKHADQYFRTGRAKKKDKLFQVYAQTVPYEIEQIKTLYPLQYTKINYIMYLFSNEEFEAYFHSDYEHFKQMLSEKQIKTKKEALELWRDYHLHCVSYGLFAGKLGGATISTGFFTIKVPDKYKPFKFKDWCPDIVIDRIIYAVLNQEKDKSNPESFLDKLKSLAPKELLFAIRAIISPKWLPIIFKYKKALEKEIDRRSDIYFKKYQRIPLLAIEELDLK